MATPATLETSVRYILGESTANFWSSAEILEYIDDAIAETSELVGKDVFRDLIEFSQYLADGTSRIIAQSNDMLRVLNLWIHESDGNFSRPFDFVSRERLQEQRRAENDQSFDSTPTRMYATASNFDDEGVAFTSDADINGFEIYPLVPALRTIRLEYIAKPASSGTLDMPAIVIKAVRERVISVAASKKSFDLEMSDRYDRKAEMTMLTIKRTFFNRSRMTMATKGYVRRY